jgi:CubicO group peptidase (beta-lactamase class C family)
VHQVLFGYVERKERPGLIAPVSNYDDVDVETLRTIATIFGIASITKATAVAAMILKMESKLRLDESIEPWLPKLCKS